MLQVVSDFADVEAEFAMLRRIVEKLGPAALVLARCRRDSRNGWRRQLAALERANAAGLPMKAQVCARPVGLLFGFELTLNPFSLHPTYQEIAKLPLAERVARLRDPALRARLLAEAPRDSGFAREPLRVGPPVPDAGDARLRADAGPERRRPRPRAGMCRPRRSRSITCSRTAGAACSTCPS